MYKGKRNRPKRKAPPHRVNNSLATRMRKVGPDHFGLLLVDSGKEHYTVRLTNFYGDILWEPEPVPCRKGALEKLIADARNQMGEHGLVESVVGIERTGRWHEPIKQMLKTNWPVKMVHPFTTKQLRQPASPGIKTDKVDLTAMQRAMVCGYGLDDPEVPLLWLELRELSRYRADLVGTRASLKAQCKCRMEALIPGYTSLFEDFWKSAAPAALIEAYPSARKMLRAPAEKMVRKLAKAGTTCQRSTAERARLWAAQAAPADPVGELNAIMLHDSLGRVRQQSACAVRYEVRLMERLVRTPLVLLLTITGVNVVSAAGFGSEMGPHENYANGRNVTGRAGLFPSRYQSDETDRSGPIVRAGRNARLRHAILVIAHNLLTRNPYVRAWKALPAHRRWGGKTAEVAVGNKFVRIMFRMLREGAVFEHPQAGRQDSAICKLLAFGRERKLTEEQLYDLAAQALDQLPDNALPFELRSLLDDGWNGRRNSPRPTATPSRRAARRPVCVAGIIQDIERRIAAKQGGHPSADS